MIIALKGYIGSGKSTLSSILEKKYDFKIINADKLVHEMYEDSNIQQEICNLFELEEFSRKELSKIVFKDSETLKRLENYIHPKLENKMNKLIEEYKSNIVLDCQVIDKLNIEYDYEILVVAPREEIIKRIQKRDGKTEEEIENVLKVQEKFLEQTKKIFPLNMVDNENMEKDLDKILSIFTKDMNSQDYDYDEDDEDDDDDEYYW